MKKVCKLFLSVLIISAVVLSMFAFNVSAASASMTGAGEYEIGKSFSVKINFNADATLYAVEVDVSYNSSVLRLDSVSGADFNGSNGSVKIVDDKFSATKPAKASSYTLNFTAIAAGNSNVSASFLGAGDAVSNASSSIAVAVVAPKPSSNANLSSIKLSSGSLSPAFNPNTTSYTATVKYSVESITISGSVADGKSTYSGGGTFNLQVGNNERVLTVTAEDGTKKSYTINIKRMTEQETADAEQAARDANPLLVVIDGVDYTIVNSFEGIPVPLGFTEGTITRKEAEIAVLNDDGGRYQLCWLVDANGENGSFYNRDENDNFTKLAFINANNQFYIVEDISDDIVLPSTFVREPFDNNGQKFDAIKYVDEMLKDFYIFNCYVPVQAENALYRYDSVEGTMQRAIDFDAAVKAASDLLKEQSEKSWFESMDKMGKIVFFAIIAVAVLLVAVAILLIVKISSSKNEELDEEYVSEMNSDFVIDDFDESPAEEAEEIVQDEDVDETAENSDPSTTQQLQSEETDDEEE